MATFTTQFRCEVVVPDGFVYQGQATSLIVPTVIGKMGILANRAPMVARLAAGAMTLQDLRGAAMDFFVSGGFVQVREETVMVVAEECTPAGELDREEIWEELQAARKIDARTPEQAADKQEKLTSLRAKFRLVQKHRKAREKGDR